MRKLFGLGMLLALLVACTEPPPPDPLAQTFGSRTGHEWIAVFDDESMAVRLAMISQLSEVGPDALPVLDVAIRDPRPLVQEAGACTTRAILVINSGNRFDLESLAVPLAENLQSESIRNRACVAMALASLKGIAVAQLPELRRAELLESEPWVKDMMIEAIAAIN